MTKAELIEILKDVPNDAVIDIYDIRNITHPDFDVYPKSSFDFDTGTQVVTIMLH